MFATIGALLAMFILCPAVAFISSARAAKRNVRSRRSYRWWA